MYAQYNVETKALQGYHDTRLDDEGIEIIYDPVPDNLIHVPSIYEDEVRQYSRVLSVDDSDPENKSIVLPANIIEAAALFDLIESRTAEGEEIVSYLSGYLNDKAKYYGFDNYHAAIIYLNSSNLLFQKQAQSFLDCADAIWTYFEDNRDNFAATGLPTLETIKVAHPKFETFKTW